VGLVLFQNSFPTASFFYYSVLDNQENSQCQSRCKPDYCLARCTQDKQVQSLRGLALDLVEEEAVVDKVL
jgi:hypothetical protein